MRRVVERIGEARDKGEIVGIFGDFDCDGVTSSVILKEGLNHIGATSVVYLPDKLSQGHGLNTEAVDWFQQEGAALIVTLDCGMMNHEEVRYANERGIPVIIIDHHHVPEVLPEAYAIINPKLPDETYPFRELCGAGTTFKVVEALYRTYLPDEVDQLKWLLDVVAIGTIADVMPLVGENRVIVKYGLLVLSKTRRLGLQAMIEVGKIPIDEHRVPTAETVAFQIAPRINAASRMAHAELAHDLLMATEPDEALRLARELQSLNTARQKQSQACVSVVRALVETEFREKAVVCTSSAEYPYGIAGLVAGRIAREYQKPTAILTNEGAHSRGSLRGVPGFDLMSVLTASDDILLRYGGHAQAAGLMIPNEHLGIFEERFDKAVRAWQKKHHMSEEATTEYDMEISHEHVQAKFHQALQKLAPFGEGNREPLFLLRAQEIATVRRIGGDGKHLKMKLRLGENRAPMDAVGFSLGDLEEGLESGDHIDLLCTLDENEWRGSKSLQLKIEHLKKTEVV